MPEAATFSFPPNERVNFVLQHWADIRTYESIPVYFAILVSPLFFHLNGWHQAAWMTGIVAVGTILMLPVKKWVRERTGVAKSRFPLKHPEESETVGRKRRWRIFAFCCLAITTVMASIFIPGCRCIHAPYPGWLPRGCNVWATMSIFQCIRFMCDPTNIWERRRWYGAGAALLTLAYCLDAAMGFSFVILMISLGAVMTVLSLLDLSLLLRLAPPIGESVHA